MPPGNVLIGCIYYDEKKPSPVLKKKNIFVPAATAKAVTGKRLCRPFRMRIHSRSIRSHRRGCVLISAFLFWIIKDCLFLLGYLSGRQSFLKPLSPQEEREALMRMRDGDDDARQMLHIARKYKVPGCTFDDLISIGSVGLIKAVRSYDMRTGTSLSTYAARCIENEILMSLRQSRKQQADISLDEPLGTDRPTPPPPARAHRRHPALRPGGRRHAPPARNCRHAWHLALLCIAARVL